MQRHRFMCAITGVVEGHGVVIHTVSSFFISVLMSPLLCRVLPRYLNLVTCGSWRECRSERGRLEDLGKCC